ncbi:hypothetical protein NDA10_001397 [Ustilago hordei]|nr:hypothetical protein NDA10_001397 [Ustilago hordei]UTT93435.1 hypothetical protein NDA17_003612 [Ustilago hordei]
MVFWSNLVKFMESKCWSDRTEWQLVSTQMPPMIAAEEDIENLGYMDENLFDEVDREPLMEYIDMDSSSEDKQSEGTVKEAEHKLVAETQIDDELFGLMATCPEQSKNLDPTVSEALGGEDRKHWEEAMRKELDGLEAMGTWEITDLPKGANTINTCWVLKIKTDANLVPTKFKARLVAWGFTQHKGIDYTEVFTPVAPIQSIQGVLAIAHM